MNILLALTLLSHPSSSALRQFSHRKSHSEAVRTAAEKLPPLLRWSGELETLWERDAPAESWLREGRRSVWTDTCLSR